ncbi:threonine-phosphate decarboxylase CobD [Hoeflea sp. WL0058]|uniref:threonine-phosphate decarboxylase n=1 Tax=Flavimaribacter sediminis TaxID=2865987 RepID=A0AAE2ZMF1_9HYPH|nr:threonine-phosphate decarboxylase CobD [Flavimaribacter sediminis]MBW8636002.1 threonine-phosphate decarboxylase CobD [Flavimaribacter sediminis]
MKAATVEHGGGLFAASRLYGGAPSDWLDLSTGVNPVPAPLPAISPDVWNRLPDDDLMHEACNSAARYFGLPPGKTPLAAPGSQSVIQRLGLLGRGKVAILGPTYAEYERCFVRSGNPVAIAPSPDALSGDERFVVVVNPNNPDGRTFHPTQLEALASDLVRRDGCLIVDEAFCDLSPELSMAPYASITDGVLVLRSFGKFFGLAGLRLGFVIAQQSILERFRKALGPWAVSGPALAIAAAIYDDAELVHRIRSDIQKLREKLGDILVACGLEIVGGADLFTLVRHDRADQLFERLCGHHILVRKFDYEPEWLRIGLPRDEAARSRLQSALAEALGI